MATEAELQAWAESLDRHDADRHDLLDDDDPVVAACDWCQS